MNTDDSEELKFIRLETVLTLVPVSESTLYRMVSRKEFPKPIKVGGNMWVEGQVKAWMKAQVEAQEDELI